MSADLSASKGPTPEDQEATKNAQACVEECHIEQLIHDTKFLRVDSLLELIKALIFQSQLNDVDLNSSAGSTTMGVSNPNGSPPNNNNNNHNNNTANTTAKNNSNTGGVGNNSVNNNDSKIDNDAAVFSLEILIKVVLQNR